MPILYPSQIRTNSSRHFFFADQHKAYTIINGAYLFLCFPNLRNACPVGLSHLINKKINMSLVHFSEIMLERNVDEIAWLAGVV